MISSAKHDLLLQHCADLGIDVEYVDLGPKRHGEYHHERSLIQLNERCTAAQLLSGLAHEVGHALYCENGQTANCRRADEVGAALVIEVAEYAEAEYSAGEHPGAVAAYLGVTRRLVLGWRRWYLRTHAPREVESDEVP